MVKYCGLSAPGPRPCGEVSSARSAGVYVGGRDFSTAGMSRGGGLKVGSCAIG
jgi:hypothetical protein